MDTNPKHPLQVIYESMLEDEGFFDNYAKEYLSVIRDFIPEIMNKKEEEINHKDIYLLVRKKSNGIASVGACYTGINFYEDIKNIKNIFVFFQNCKKIINHSNLKEVIYNSNTINEIFSGVYDTSNNPIETLITNRMVAAVFPQYLGPVLKHENFQNTIDKTNEFLIKSGTNDIINTGNSWLECNKHFFDYCKEHIEIEEDENNDYHISLLLDYLHRKNDNQLMEIYKMKSENIILKETSDLLLQTKNLILTGAPGTGKTYLAKQIADELTRWDKNAEANKGKTNPCVTMVQFHPSYDYTDFVEGLRPIDNGNGEIGFERKDGTFKEFCKKAISKKDKNFVFIIDEINRGEISKIFGELFYAIDPGYRGKLGTIKTQYQNLIKGYEYFSKGFYVPENVYIIGTMNDIDRSVDSFDFAMRRRFAWKEITAEDTQHSILDSLQDDKRNEAINRMNSLNKAISEMHELGSQYQLGASYFMKIKEYGYNYADLWHFHIKGLLYEYLRGVPGADSKLAVLQKAYELKNEQ